MVKNAYDLMEEIRILRMGNTLLQHALKEVCDELEEVTGKPHGLVELARAILNQEKTRWD